MARAYIGVGSNIDPETNITAALRMLSRAASIVAVSTFYRTPPVGAPDTPDFYNGVVAIETELPPRELKFNALRQIEEALGRRRCEDRNAPRTIDLDILVYDDLVVNEPDLVIPDPDIAVRPFVAVPLAKLSPDMVLPGSNIALTEVCRPLDSSEMTALADLTARLQQEIGHEPG